MSTWGHSYADHHRLDVFKKTGCAPFISSSPFPTALKSPKPNFRKEERTLPSAPICVYCVCQKCKTMGYPMSLLGLQCWLLLVTVLKWFGEAHSNSKDFSLLIGSEVSVHSYPALVLWAIGKPETHGRKVWSRKLLTSWLPGSRMPCLQWHTSSSKTKLHKHPKQHHQLGTKCSGVSDYGGHSHSNHHAL